MSATDQEEEQTEDQAHEEQSAGFELFGKRLKPYTAQRYVAAQGMGLLYPFVGDDGAEQIERTGLYPGIFKDAAICLWICSIDVASDQTAEQVRAGEWNVSRAFDKPKEAKEAAFAWAERNGVFDPYNPNAAEAKAIFQRVVQPVEAAKFGVNSPGESGDPKNAGKRARRNGRASKPRSPKKRGTV